MVSRRHPQRRLRKVSVSCHHFFTARLWRSLSNYRRLFDAVSWLGGGSCGEHLPSRSGRRAIAVPGANCAGRLIALPNDVVLDWKMLVDASSMHRKEGLFHTVREEVMPTLMGFGTFAALIEEQISEKISRRILSGDQGMIVWWSVGAGVHVEPHSHANEQIVWMLKGKMEFRLGSEQRVCGQGDVVVIPGGTEHEAWFLEDTEVIDFFAPPRDDFLLGGKPAYMSEG